MKTNGMKQLIYVILTSSILMFNLACSDMNDMHDVYLKNGETVYIGKVDSVKMFPGDERLLIHYWLTDPRAKEVKIYWDSKADSLVIDVAAHQPEDALEFLLEPIAEGDHSFLFYTNDKEGNNSIKYEVLQSVYGPIYQSMLTNRLIQELTVIDNSLLISWAGSLSEQEIGVNILYVTLGNETKQLFFPVGSLRDPVILDDVDFYKSVYYQTLYMPSSEAIDTFMTDMSRMNIKQRINIALGKAVTTSGDLNDSYTGANAIDGIINEHASRWVTDDSNNEHWLELDFGGPYSIDGFKTYTGANGSFNYPTTHFDFQVDVDGEWITVISVKDNTDAQYSVNFENVITSKVRYYIPAYSNNQVRLYELEVYTTKVY